MDISKEKKFDLCFIFIILMIALAVRCFVLMSWVDMPGDGPTRAMYAYYWHTAPYWQMHGIWLPGYMYLSGLFNYIFDDPYISLRILNIILSTISILAFYLLIQRIVSRVAAIVSACIIAFLPMHVGLSASSMSDISFICEILLAMLFMTRVTEHESKRTLYLCLSLAALVLASMTRYEGWLFIPIFPLYHYVRTRRIYESLLILVILSIFPVAWMFGNYLSEGKVLLGISGVKEYSQAVKVGLFKTIKNTVKVMVVQMGWAVASLSLIGLAIMLYNMLRAKASYELMFYSAITLIIWLFMLFYGWVRGRTMMDRYLLVGIVLLIPFAAVTIETIFKKRKYLAASIFILILLFGLTKTQNFPLERLTNVKPERIQEVAKWLESSEYRGKPVLLTKLWWESTYLPVFIPEIGRHDVNYFIYAWYAGMSTERYKRFLNDHPPAIMISCDDDSKLKTETERLIGSIIDEHCLIEQIGEIKIFDITKQMNYFRSRNM